ncbi:retrovirus-related pol polyprotein from transposon TNT 1-94 [Tanacetum coccineum]
MIVGSGLDWLFDIDALTRTMNYEPIVAEPIKDYILLQLWIVDPPYSQYPKSSRDDGSKPSIDDGKKVDEDPRKDINVVGGKTSIELQFDPNMPALEVVSIFDFSRDDDDVGRTQKGNSCIEGSKMEKGYAGRASTIQVTRSLDFSGFTKWKKGYKGIDYDEVFAPVARIEAIRLFLAYSSFIDFVVYQVDVKSAFLYGKIEEEVYVCQPSGFENPDFLDRVYKVEKHCMDYIKLFDSWSKVWDDIQVVTWGSCWGRDKNAFRSKSSHKLHHGVIKLIQLNLYLVTQRFSGQSGKSMGIFFSAGLTSLDHEKFPAWLFAHVSIHGVLESRTAIETKPLRFSAPFVSNYSNSKLLKEQKTIGASRHSIYLSKEAYLSGLIRYTHACLFMTRPEMFSCVAHQGLHLRRKR